MDDLLKALGDIVNNTTQDASLVGCTVTGTGYHSESEGYIEVTGQVIRQSSGNFSVLTEGGKVYAVQPCGLTIHNPENIEFPIRQLIH